MFGSRAARRGCALSLVLFRSLPPLGPRCFLQVWKDKNGKEGVRPSAYDEPGDWPKSCRENFKEPVIERRGKGGGEFLYLDRVPL